jgi:membrane fusion protein
MFRTEAIEYRADRLSGDVAIAVPVAWQAIGYLVFGGVAVALAFLSIANYARVETVSGTIVPDTGVSAVVPSRSGIITRVPVKDGQIVAAGAELAAIRAEEDSAQGLSAAARISDAIAQQDASLSAQASAALMAARAQQGQLAAQRSGLAAEISQLESQIAIQVELIDSASRDVERARSVAERGFISARDMQYREELLMSRRQGLSQLTQSLASRRAALSEAERSTSQIAAQAAAQNAGLAASRAQVAQTAANTDGSRSYVLRAPVSGRVTALIARAGQAVSPQAQIMAIVPKDSTLQAELAVPSAAIGFVKPGQVVRLAIDAFPYQRFGTVSGKVITVATSPMSRTAPGGGTAISVYPVVVALERASITAFGRDEALVPGMALTARITTEKQSLLEWLFEPLYAVRKR